MSAVKMPEEYRPVLRKKADILKWLQQRFHWRSYDGRSYPLCLNVKLYNQSFDWTFDEFVAGYEEQTGEVVNRESPLGRYWLDACREEWESLNQEALFQRGVEDASRIFRTDAYDTFNYLWDGTDVRPVEFSFQGRSGGWLSLDRFAGREIAEVFYRTQDGRTLLRAEHDDFAGYNWLRLLYRFCLRLVHDVTPQKAAAEIKYQAIFNFFANRCAEPTYGVFRVKQSVAAV
jgi:hypothetical protein